MMLLGFLCVLFLSWCLVWVWVFVVVKCQRLCVYLLLCVQWYHFFLLLVSLNVVFVCVCIFVLFRRRVLCFVVLWRSWSCLLILVSIFLYLTLISCSYRITVYNYPYGFFVNFYIMFVYKKFWLIYRNCYKLFHVFCYLQFHLSSLCYYLLV